MKRILLLILLLSLASCAAKEPPFDPVAKFREAEQKMQHFKYEEARKDYQEIQENAPDRSYDADIMLRIADTYYGEEKYAEAQVDYRSFLNFHPAHRDAPYAQYQIAMCSYNEITTIDRDPSITRTALDEFRKLLEKYPGSPYESEAKKHIAVCRGDLAQYELYVARFYFKKGSYLAAAGRLEKLLRDYPGLSTEKDALYYASLACAELARGVEKEDAEDVPAADKKSAAEIRAERAKRREEALRYFDLLTAKYPDAARSISSRMKELRAS